MKLLEARFGRDRDVSDLMLQFVSNAAQKFVETNPHIAINVELKQALASKSDTVLVIAIKATEAKSWVVLISFQNVLYKLLVIHNNNVEVTDIRQTSSQLSPALSRKVAFETLRINSR